MFCKNCGKEIDNIAAVCVHCGVAVENGNKFCPNCGMATPEDAAFCTGCGISLKRQNPAGDNRKSRIVAGLLGIFLGGFGIHNFYLGFNSRAVIQIVVSLVTCGVGSLWGFIEGILILCGNISKDANGNELKADL